MDRTGLDLRFHHSESIQSEESALDLERNGCNRPKLLSSSPSSLQAFASSGQLSESNAAYFSWPTSSRLNDAAEDRANYFGNLQKGELPETLGLDQEVCGVMWMLGNSHILVHLRQHPQNN